MAKTTRHVAIGKCNDCGSLMFSWAGGIFSYCLCGNSFIDQDRFGGSCVRIGGNAELIEQICPTTCSCGKFHKDNKKIINKDSLREYLKKQYDYDLPEDY